MNTFYDALTKEAQFTCEILCDGITQIRKANYAKRGIYFQAFTSLSTGYERIGKLCILLDNMITSNGTVPDAKLFQNELRHNLIRIYEKVKNLQQKRNYCLEFIQSLDPEEHLKILSILSDFAKGDRYSNFDLIMGKNNYQDPIEKWHHEVDSMIYDKKVSKKKKAEIEYNARTISFLADSFTMISYTKEDGSKIDTVYEGSHSTGITEAVQPYRQLYTFQIARYFMEVLSALKNDWRKNSDFSIPSFDEIFRVFYNSDSYVKGRTTWKMV